MANKSQSSAFNNPIRTKMKEVYQSIKESINLDEYSHQRKIVLYEVALSDMETSRTKDNIEYVYNDLQKHLKHVFGRTSTNSSSIQ